jgi:hypothetical protein
VAANVNPTSATAEQRNASSFGSIEVISKLEEGAESCSQRCAPECRVLFKRRKS